MKPAGQHPFHVEFRTASTVVVLVVVGWLGGVSDAFAQNRSDGEQAVSAVMSREDRTQAAQQALSVGDYEMVIAQTNALLERWPKDENALILKAAALLFGPHPDADQAGRLLRKLPRERRRQPDVEALDLWKDYRHGSEFLPTVRERLQLGRARDLLEKDPSDPIANLVVGILSLEDQRDLDNAARLGLGVGVGDLQEMLFYEATAVLDERTGRVGFRSDRGGPEIMVQWNDERMAQASETAVRSLIRASARGPLRSIAVRYLTEAAIRAGRVRDGEFLLTEYATMYPESARAHLLLGLLRYMLVKDEAAAESFEHALTLMTPEEAAPWLNPRTVVSTSIESDYRNVDEMVVEDYWARQDREWSAPGNDRLVEHMGRMAYADVIWGRPEMELRGWETEPGQVLIRYGFPAARLQWQTETGCDSGKCTGDRFHILHYGDRYWIFQDLAKAGKPIFYSPPADFYQGGRAVMGDDWALIAKEQFRDNPLESDLDETGRLQMVILPSVFENRNATGEDATRTIVAPICIRGAAFAGGSAIKRFDRLEGEPVPSPTDSTNIQFVRGCTGALSVYETDNDARQVSHEVRSGSYWSVGRYDIPAARDSDGIRSSDILLADLIVEQDPKDDIPAGSFVRNDLLIRPVAEAIYRSGQPMYVYAEAYGLDDREGDRLIIQAVLTEGRLDDNKPSRLSRLFGGRDEAAVSVAFDDEIRAKSHERYLILETEDLQPGWYTLALRFTERTSGKQAISRREIRID